MTLEEVVVASAENGDQEIFNNAGQAWNHVLYWDQFKGGPAAPDGAVEEAIARDDGGLDGLKDAIVKEAGNVFGTGWVWVVANDGAIEVVGMQDVGNPLPEGKTVLMGVDASEHAYYLDYESPRSEHVAAVLDRLVN
jgi:Fe-Mn family superoxide dismutase